MINGCPAGTHPELLLVFLFFFKERPEDIHEKEKAEVRVGTVLR